MREKDYKERYNNWCYGDEFDADTKKELLSIAENEREIEDRFYKELDFGTGGLRGIIGAGTNRMNIYTVRKATQGLANYILKDNAKEKGVAIAYDSRHMSAEFSEEAALCLNANGIKTYCFDSLRPTPELSFALRELGCVAGIVITASHNPAEYNGYKVYWEDGAQITFPRDKEIIKEVKSVTDFHQVKTMKKEMAISMGLYHTIGKEIDDKYIEALKELVIHPDLLEEAAKDISIVYTPLNGTGNIPVRRVLKELGFEHVYVVEEQEMPDGDFPTIPYPNPEEPDAFSLALKLAKTVDADIILATDPDADRLGVYAKDSNTGEYHSFTGNMLGVLICEYIMSQQKELGILPRDGALLKTIVTTNMGDAIAKEYGVQIIEVLTGFKYIGEQIKFFEQTGSNHYVFGFEESYGCLIGTHARDKDAVAAAMVLCEAAAYYQTKGLTLWDQMLRLYETYGYYKESLATLTLKGVEGKNRITELMNSMRDDPPAEVAGYQVIEVRDYKSGMIRNVKINETRGTGLSKSNVLYFELENNAWYCARPSGTEPKIKFYFGVKGETYEGTAKDLEALEKAVMAKC